MTFFIRDSLMLAVFLDLETSGLDAYRHRVLEIAFKIVRVDIGETLFTYHSGVKQPWDAWEKRDPLSVEFNGFTWKKNLLGQDEKKICEDVIQIFTEWKIERKKAVFICQNPAFDRCFFSQLVDVYVQEKLQWPYHWLDFASMYWALFVKQLDEGHPFPSEIILSKNAIARSYDLPSESEPHTAINGVDHLLLCYQTVIGFRDK